MTNTRVLSKFQKLRQAEHRHQLKLASVQHRIKRNAEVEQRRSLRLAILIKQIGWSDEPFTELERRLQIVQARISKQVRSDVTQTNQRTEPTRGVAISSNLPFDKLLDVGNLCLTLQLHQYPTDALVEELQQVDKQLKGVQ